MAKDPINEGAPKKSPTKKSAVKKTAVKKTAAKKTTAASPTTKVARKRATKSATTPSSALPAASAAQKLADAARPVAPQSIAKAEGSTSPAPETMVLVKCDVGFGNTAFLRGNGPGLSWDRGVAMENVTSDEWVWSTRSAAEAFEVKVLINDDTWAIGPNSTVIVGEKTVVEPEF